MFQVQIRLATAVASSLKKQLSGEEEELLATPQFANGEAYDLYLQGAYLMQEGTEEATDVALQYFTRAVDLDPDLVEAHVGLGTVQAARLDGGWEGGLSNLELMERSFETALRLDPADPRARRGLIYVEFFRGRSEACLIQGREAARLGDPNDVETLLAQAQAYHLCGLGDQSIPLYRRVIEIDPMNRAAHWDFVFERAWTGEPERAIEAGEEYFRRFGDDETIHLAVAGAYHLLGSRERAREHYENATSSLGSRGSPLGTGEAIAQLYAGILLDQMGARAAAESEWSDGAARTVARLQAEPDHVGLRLHLAMFRVCSVTTPLSLARRRKPWIVALTPTSSTTSQRRTPTWGRRSGPRRS